MLDFLRVRLHAPAPSLPALADFYGTQLGFEHLWHADELVAVGVGTTRLEFVPSAERPFYHFALLAPGDRFAELLEWAGARTELLPEKDSGDVAFDFSGWGARACYFHDPAANIVELIAHRGVGETRTAGPFAAEEVLGFSELGLVGDTVSMAGALRRRLGLELWDGVLEGPDHLAFVGEPARTLILCPAGRPWLPTRRPAEAHPTEAVLSGPPEAEALLEDSRYRIERSL